MAKRPARKPKAAPEVVDAPGVNPALRSTASNNMLPRIELMRACYGGTETMRQMGRFFLPQYPRETDVRYNQRLAATFALNKLREAVEAASAKPFKNLLTIKDADQDLHEMIWDADLRGNHLHLIGHKFFNEAVLNGMCHILVDHPTTSNLPSLAAQKKLAVRPFMQIIKPEDLLACYDEKVGGEQQIVHARISSSRRSFSRETFREEVFDQVFVIEKEVVQLWERKRAEIGQGIASSALVQGGTILTNYPIPMRYLPGNQAFSGYGSGGPWELVMEQRISIDRVPLATMIAGDEESERNVRPIFMDLAYKQIEHWISSSDQRNILSAGRFAMLACSGINIEDESDQGFEIGPWKILTTPDAQGRWYYVEPDGKAIEAGQRDLDSLEQHMDLMSLNPVTSQPGRQYVSQNERSIMEARTNTVVHDLAIRCKDALERAVDFMGMWSGKDYSNVELEMNFDFSGTDEKAASISSVLMAVTNKTLSREGALYELKRLQLLSDSFDIDEELKREIVDPAVPGEGKPDKSERDFGKGQSRPTKQT